MTEGLLRQRRNLMVTSLIIILLSFGGVRIEEVGALGTKLVFERADALYIGLWILYAYFFVRYYQYFREEPEVGMATAFWGKVNAVTFDALRKAAATQRSLNKRELAGEFRFSELKKVTRFVRQGSVVVRQDVYGTPEFSVYEVNTLRFVPAFVLSAFHVVLNRSAFTDYILPFAIGIAAGGIGACGNWEGALCNVIVNDGTLSCGG